VTDEKNEAQLFAFGPGGGIIEKPLGKSEDIAPEVNSPVAAGELVLGLWRRLACLDAADKLTTLWSVSKEPALKNTTCHLILSADAGLVFNGSGQLVLFTFDRQGAKIQGKAKLCGTTLMHPALVGSRLFVRDAHAIYCYELGRP
jgi:outer membrane protein assembly factor BamB